MKTLEHLLDPAFDDFDDLDASGLLSAQANTVSFMEQFGSDPSILSADAATNARTTFAAVTSPSLTDAEKKKALATLNVPAAVKHLAGMLSEYDWEFVNQAKEMRGYVVAKLMEETKHPDARIRLKAIELLGKITEVGSFTERIEIRKVDATADELQDRLRAKLTSLLPKVVEVQTVTPK